MFQMLCPVNLQLSIERHFGCHSHLQVNHLNTSSNMNYI